MGNKRMKSVVWCTVFLTCVTFAQAQKKAAHSKSKPSETVDSSAPARLLFVDGTSIEADEAWESEQGIWYRRGGMSHLIPKDRVKRIERNSQPREVPQVARVIETTKNVDETQKADSSAGPVRIYLKGGAQFEADTATESTAGVWYRRGSLSVFVEQSRIDRIEREEPESLGDSATKARAWTTGNGRIDSLIKQSGSKYGVDPYLIFCVMEQESHFNPRALSPKGARGLMQLMPGTSARFGIRHPSDPAQNVAGGTRYLKQLIDQFNGRIDLVLASYNAGEGAVMKFGRRVPPYRETRDYVKRISYRYRRAKPVTPAKEEALVKAAL
jgi:hypothetical protein